MHAIDVGGIASPRRHRWRQYRLRTMLLVMLVAAVALGIYAHLERQKERVWRALDAICDKGVDANLLNPNHVVVTFKNGNVTDDDLERFFPALAAKSSIGRIMELRLSNSKVSDNAVDQLRRKVPECAVVR